MPFDPGGGADASQRAFNKYAEPIVGQPLVIVNKPGAGGTMGWAEMVRAEPDGYTLAIVTPPFNVIPPLARPQQTGYTLDQFTYICTYAVVPDVLLVREDSDFETLADLIDYAKANPGKIKAANTGTLGADFMTTLLIENATGMEFTQIPFTGGAQALQGTLAGTTDAMVASSLFAVAQQGSLRTLGDRGARARSEHPGRADLHRARLRRRLRALPRARRAAGPAGRDRQLLGRRLPAGDQQRGFPCRDERARPAAGLSRPG